TPLVLLTVEDVPKIVAALRDGGATTPLPNALVSSSLVQPRAILFGAMNRGAGLRAALNMTPEQVIAEITKARLRGRGGAGFPTGMKWQRCRQAAGSTRYVIC